MKKYLIGFISAFMLVAGIAWAATATDILYFSYNNTNFARMWVDDSNRISQQAMQDYKSTAFNLWPTYGLRPQADSLSEITLERYLWNDSRMERFNISAMNDYANNGAYRFGVERGGGGQFRDIIFCFENTGGPQGGATCPFKITLQGVFASGDGGATWHQL